jgi:hypothetical protein
MSRLASIRQLDTSSTEALKRDLARLVELIDSELDAVSARIIFEWQDVPPLQRGSVAAKFGQLVRMDTTPGQPAPHVVLPQAGTADIGKSVGMAVNAPSPTCILVAHGAGAQRVGYTGTAATLVASSLVIRTVTWSGSTWELGY